MMIGDSRLDREIAESQQKTRDEHRTLQKAFADFAKVVSEDFVNCPSTMNLIADDPMYPGCESVTDDPYICDKCWHLALQQVFHVKLDLVDFAGTEVTMKIEVNDDITD